MRVEPAVKQAVAFVDGQNLFYAAKDAFGYQRDVVEAGMKFGLAVSEINSIFF